MAWPHTALLVSDRPQPLLLGLETDSLGWRAPVPISRDTPEEKEPPHHSTIYYTRADATIPYVPFGKSRGRAVSKDVSIWSHVHHFQKPENVGNTAKHSGDSHDLQDP